MKKILVAVDLSAATVQVCNVARDLAQSLGARLLILHLVPPTPVVFEYYAASTLDLEQLPRAAKKRAAEKMRALGHWFQKRCPATKVILHDGAPVAGILRTLAQARPDFVVLGSHGHSAAFEMLLGSVAHGVVRKSPVPVVLVPIRPRARRARPFPVIASDAIAATH
jgi:nucleotide-binding universal stress UspA family protein